MADTLTILRAAKEIAQQVRGDYMLDGKELEALKASHLALIASMEAQEPVAWLVFDEDGLPEHATIDPQMAQDHINEAIQEFDFMQAAKWTVRPVYTHAQPKAEPARLTDAEIVRIQDSVPLKGYTVLSFARAIESKIRGDV